jgi:hypothetical protein
MNYIVFVANNWRPPTLADALAQPPPGSGGSEFAQPPFYYFLVAPIYAVASRFSNTFAFYLLRVISVLLSVAAIVVGYKAIRLVTADRLAVATALLLLAFSPKALVASAGIDNDQLSWLLGSAAIYFILDGVIRHPRPERIALATGAAIITKLLTIPLSIGGFLACAFQSPSLPSGCRLRTVSVYLVILGLCTGWLFAWNLYAFGTLTPLPFPHGPLYLPNKPALFFFPDISSLFHLQGSPGALAYEWQAQLAPNILNDNLVTLFSFWFDSRSISGWPVGLSNWLTFWGAVVIIPSLIILVGIFATVLRRDSQGGDRRRLGFVMLLVLAFYLVELNISDYQLWIPSNGRYLYSIYPIFSIFFGLGIQSVYLRVRKLVSR